jgi:hypothetical protein
MLRSAMLGLLLGLLLRPATGLDVPSCDYVTIAYVGESGRTCLHLDPTPPLLRPSNGTACLDTAGWCDRITRTLDRVVVFFMCVCFVRFRASSRFAGFRPRPSRLVNHRVVLRASINSRV